MKRHTDITGRLTLEQVMQLCYVALDSSQQRPVELRLSCAHVELLEAPGQFQSCHLARLLLHMVGDVVLECVRNLRHSELDIFNASTPKNAYLVDVMTLEQAHIPTSAAKSGRITSPGLTDRCVSNSECRKLIDAYASRPSVSAGVRLVLRVLFAELWAVEAGIALRLELKIEDLLLCRLPRGVDP